TRCLHTCSRRSTWPRSSGADSGFATAGSALCSRAGSNSEDSQDQRRTTMRFIAMVRATKQSESGAMPSEKLLTEMGKFNEELVKAGVMLAGEGIHPSSKGKRIEFSGTNRTVKDGPFPVNEVIAGYWVLQAKSMDEIVEWMKRSPNPMDEVSDIEIRPLFEAADFGEEFTPELRAQEDRLRAEIQKKK